MNKGQISDPSVKIKPSKKLCDYINTIKVSEGLPVNIANILLKNKISEKSSPSKPVEPQYLLTDKDIEFVKSLKLNNEVTFSKTEVPLELENAKGHGKLLTVQDVHWLYNDMQSNSQTRVYLHELLEGSTIVLPQNEEVPRNPMLEKRCERLRASQQNQEYSNMTKNVDPQRKQHPEDTISFQIKQMNRHLIAIFQFILSVCAGFAFGFIGVELLIGNLDFGFRLLLGIICALTIALAELYFLAKKLNEDLRFESVAESKKKSAKLD